MTVEKTLEQRGSRYGEFADHARIAQGIQDVMRAAPKWDHLDLDMKQALSVIADKIARILNGDPFYADNWHDIQGYAKLIENRINMLEEKTGDLFAPNVVDTSRKAVKSWRDSERLQNSGLSADVIEKLVKYKNQLDSSVTVAPPALEANPNYRTSIQSSS